MNESQTKSELNPFIESGKSDTFEHHRGDITHTGTTSHGPIIRIHSWLINAGNLANSLLGGVLEGEVLHFPPQVVSLTLPFFLPGHLSSAFFYN